MSDLEMLRAPRDLAALQATGRGRSHPLVNIRVRRNDLGRDRFAISTGRKVGKAVVRNRVRRRLREILRQDARPTVAGWDILLVARPGSADARFADLRAVVGRLVTSGTREG